MLVANQIRMAHGFAFKILSSAVPRVFRRDAGN